MKYLLYLLRWQFSTPLLYCILYFSPSTNTIVNVILSNLIGGLIFFWVDKFILKERRKDVINKSNCGCGGW